ncbi:MAG: hypothetical protein AAGF11_37605 [Myxococcota bacterium]
MSAAVDRTRWALRPFPRTLEEIATIARHGDCRLYAQVELTAGWGDVFFDGDTLIHACVGWALGRRAVLQLLEAEPFVGAQLHWHATSALITVGQTWPRLSIDLAWAAGHRPLGHRASRGPQSKSAVSPGRAHGAVSR